MIRDIAVLAVANRSIVRISSSPSALNRILSSHRITTWSLRRGRGRGVKGGRCEEGEEGGDGEKRSGGGEEQERGLKG